MFCRDAFLCCRTRSKSISGRRVILPSIVCRTAGCSNRGMTSQRVRYRSRSCTGCMIVSSLRPQSSVLFLPGCGSSVPIGKVCPPICVSTLAKRECGSALSHWPTAKRTKGTHLRRLASFPDDPRQLFARWKRLVEHQDVLGESSGRLPLSVVSRINIQPRLLYASRRFQMPCVTAASW